MFLGRFQLGDWVPIPVRTTNSSGVVTAPTSSSNQPPIAALWSGSAKVETVLLPVITPAAVTGLFIARHRLSSSYSAGQYAVFVTYTVSSHPGEETHTFEVVPGGNANGAVTSAVELNRGGTEHFIYATDGGLLRDGRNPF